MSSITARIFKSPAAIMLAAVALYALYPPFANLLLTRMGPLQLAVMLHGFAALSAILISLCWGPARRILRNFPAILRSGDSQPLLLAIIASGILNATTHMLFYFSLSASERFDVTALLIYETWPMLFFLIDTIFNRKHIVSITARDYMLVIITFFGFSTLVLQEVDLADWILFDNHILTVASIAVLGGLAMALNTYARRRSLLALNQLVVKHDVGRTDELPAALIVEFLVRSVNVLILGASLFLFRDHFVMPSLELWILVFVVGSITVGVASVLYDVSIFRSENAAITALWYLMPVGSLVTMAALQGRLLTTYEAVASIMIVSANFLIGLRQPLGSSFTLLYISTVAFGLWCVFVPSFSSSSYLELVSVSAIFYVLIGTYALDHTSKSIQSSEELFHDLRFSVNALSASQLSANLKRNLVEYIQKLLSYVRSNAGADAKQRIALTAANDKINRSLDKYASFSRAGDIIKSGARLLAINDSRLSGGEYVVMLLLAGLNVTIILAFRQQGLLYDLFAFTLSAAAAYLLFLVFERSAQISGGTTHLPAFSELSGALNAVLSKVPLSAQKIGSPGISSTARLGFVPSMAIFAFVFAGFSYALFYKNISIQDVPSTSPRPGVTSTNQSNRNIGIALSDWPSARVKAHVLKQIIEQHITPEVVLIPAGIGSAFESMASAHGNVDILPESWMANVPDMERRYIRAFKTVRLGALGNPGKQGLCINQAAQDKGVELDILRLNDPETVALFDYDGNGKGNLWAGDQRWSSTRLENIRAEAYGYAKNYDSMVFGEALFLNSLKRFNQSGIPSLFFCYSPSYLHKDLRAYMLEEPEFSMQAWEKITSVLGKSTNIPETGSAWPTSDINVVYSARLDSSELPLLNLLKNFSLPLDTVNEWSYRNALAGDSAEQIATEWIERNTDTILNWLLGADLKFGDASSSKTEN